MRFLKTLIKICLPSALVYLFKFIKDKEYKAFLEFLHEEKLLLSAFQRISILKKFYRISYHVESPHRQKEILEFVREILLMPGNVEGVIVEAGCYKGSSTAKFSIAAKITGRELVVFDSFEGIPQNDEPAQLNICGEESSFEGGDYCGTLEEVKSNISKYGNIESCRFVKGWFEDTLPAFKEKIAAVYLDVDLVSSTQTCLKYLFPLLSKGAVIYSHDGHLPSVISLFSDNNFWKKELHIDPPFIEGLGEKKLLKLKID